MKLHSPEQRSLDEATLRESENIRFGLGGVVLAVLALAAAAGVVLGLVSLFG